jgi:hypothetical protein
MWIFSPRNTLNSRKKEDILATDFTDEHRLNFGKRRNGGNFLTQIAWMALI